MTEPNVIHYKQRAQVKIEGFECSEVGLALVPRNSYRLCTRSTDLATNFVAIKVHAGTRQRQ